AYTASVRATVLAYLVPHEIAFVVEPPSLHDRKAFWQQRVRAPQVKVRLWSNYIRDWKSLNLLSRHRRIAGKPPVLRRDLARPIYESPRRVRKNRGKSPRFSES